MKRLVNMPLETFEDPIRMALAEYSERTDGKVSFDIDAASTLGLTPEKPYAARSESSVKHLGKSAATLYVIAFDWEDATGDESLMKFRDSFFVGTYPKDKKIMPRSKEALHSEAHLTIASLFAGAPHVDPVMFAGNMDLLSFTNEARTRIGRIAYLGQDPYYFTEASFRHEDAEPTATFTTGFSDSTGERFGDPHAVFNANHLIQVCGFIGITNEMAGEHAVALKHLCAVEPELRAA